MAKRNSLGGGRRGSSRNEDSRSRGGNRPTRKSNEGAKPRKSGEAPRANREGDKKRFSNGPRSGGPKRFGSKREESQDREKKPFSSRRKNYGGDGERSQRGEGFKCSGFSSGGPRKRSDDRENKFKRSSSGDRSERPVRNLRDKKEERGGFFQKSKSRFSSKSSDKDKIQPDFKAPVQTDKIRLNKYIANSGVCSRREADELITMGLISVNGTTITELGYKVNPGDEVRYESKVLKAEKPVYILMNKPKGYLTTTDDPQERNTVMHIIGGAVKERIYPVGRLDRNTTGLLLLTNDGDLADKLMHPSHNVKKIYKVELDRPLTKADFEKVQEGVVLEEGRAAVDDVAIVSPDGKTVGVEIHIGWNRVVRRIFEMLGYDVVKLDRSVYAGLDKKDLGRGQWRFLKKEEVVRLKHYQ